MAVSSDLTDVAQYSVRNEVAVYDRIFDDLRAIGFDNVSLYVVSADRRTLTRIAPSIAEDSSDRQSIANPFYGRSLSPKWKPRVGDRKAEKTPLEELLVPDGAAEWITFPLTLRDHLLGWMVAAA